MSRRFEVTEGEKGSVTIDVHLSEDLVRLIWPAIGIGGPSQHQPAGLRAAPGQAEGPTSITAMLRFSRIEHGVPRLAAK